ncbi:hypothetical protein [Amycolatopsis sp. GM8]|uniref:DUF7065 domain-containing protein n=1 Tax=Amycolatopsis sp. GM8 TaxID=2896530 RepID=UPI001F2419C0|nr:hypothetical protein [Amycolatopsis sp. GM8]
MTTPRLSPADDGLHPPTDDFYHYESFWYAFHVPDRLLSGWLYTGVRPNSGVTTGGMWIWDDRSSSPWDARFYENFTHVKFPAEVSERRIVFPTGMSVTTRTPLRNYDVAYSDRAGTEIGLRFEAAEPPQVTGEAPYTHAGHLDQTGRVTGELRLDGEHITVDCYAMRDRSWGPRRERGWRRMNYTWLAGPGCSALAYTTPGDGGERLFAGYVRRGPETVRLTGGERRTGRDPLHGWVSTVDLTAQGADESALCARAQAINRFFLPLATGVCVITTLRWEVDGVTCFGEDQDIWPMRMFRDHLRKDTT